MASKEQVEFYDNFIDHFESQMDNGRNTDFRNWTKKWIYKPKKVLDLGCAFGYNSAHLLETGCEVHGIDISPKCIMKAKRKYSKGVWHCGDITDGFDPGIRDFDCVLLSDVIEHVPKDRHEHLFHVLGEWTKPVSILIASIPNPEIHERVVQQTYQPVEEKVEIPELLQNMQEGGFKTIISLFLLQGIYYRMVVQKIGAAK